MATFLFLDSNTTLTVASVLFTFAIVFGLLEYGGLFKNRAVNGLLALIIGLFSGVYAPFVAALKNYLPVASLGFILLFFIALVWKLFGKQKDEEVDILSSIIALAVLLIVVGVMWSDIVQFLPNASGIDERNGLWVVGLAIVVIIFYMIQKYGKDTPHTGHAPMPPKH